jgi:hypothetical protein
MKSGQPWEIFHHALSTQRELLRTLRGATITPRAAASTLSDSAEKRRWHHCYPQPSPRYSGRCLLIETNGKTGKRLRDRGNIQTPISVYL